MFLLFLPYSLTILRLPFLFSLCGSLYGPCMLPGWSLCGLCVAPVWCLYRACMVPVLFFLFPTLGPSRSSGKAMPLEKFWQGYAPREARAKLCPSRSSGKAMPLEKLGASYAPREARARPTLGISIKPFGANINSMA